MAQPLCDVAAAIAMALTSTAAPRARNRVRRLSGAEKRRQRERLARRTEAYRVLDLDLPPRRRHTSAFAHVRDQVADGFLPQKNEPLMIVVRAQ